MLAVPAPLVLFDIDGTLISTEGRAGQALAGALSETFGTSGLVPGYSFSGKTDPQIVFELMATAGVSHDRVERQLPEVFARYLARLAAALQPGTVKVLAGVTEILDGLHSRGAPIGLLTGNIYEGAIVKLRAAGLDHHFPFGAFGSDSADRNALVAVARRRAREALGGDFLGRRIVIVGDAEADILCARAGGTRAVAVASGWTPRDTLAMLRPDALLDSLAEPGALAAILDGVTS